MQTRNKIDTTLLFIYTNTQ